MRIPFLFLLIATLAWSCNDDDPGDQFQDDLQLIENYLSDNNLQAEEHPSGLYYSIEEPGGADKPTFTSAVKVYYQGRFLDGTVFDEVQPNDPPGSFFLSGLIQGWQIGIPLIGRGGKIRLYIPSVLGYGTRGSGRNVPPNTVLIFDIELVDFNG